MPIIPGIEFLQNWTPKKHSWPALIVAIIWIAYETFAPKDPSCSNQVNYLQKQNTILINNVIRLNNQLFFQKQRANKIDSAYHSAITPYKSIINKNNHEN